MPPRERARRFPVGAEVMADGHTHVRVWAPAHEQVVVAHGPSLRGRAPLEPEVATRGYFSGRVEGLGAGGRYAFLLDDDSHPLPDPASRFQPGGPHGPSEVVDAAAFRWSDGDWAGVPARGQVIYEMHVGTFTPEGTYAAAADRLELLADVGVTVVELMPLAEFVGRFGWGYDGVDLWAPSHLYGGPDDLRRFIDRAHACKLGVILDVVYNHFGPDGNYLAQFAPGYFTRRYENDWGAAINYDGIDAAPVRELVVENAAYWVNEFHFDGLRLDATQDVRDASPEHVIAAVARRARAAAGGRALYIVAENEPQDARLVRPAAQEGYGLDAMWNDDFHHTSVVALTGRNEAYYSDYRGTAQELASAVRWGFLYQGQRYAWQKRGRGTPALDLSAERFVTYLENHDQVANTARGARLAASVDPGRLRAMTALLLLGPSTPMLFQGQEWGRRPDRFSTSPITTRSWPPRSRRAGSTSCRSFRRSRRRRSAPRSPRPARPRPSRRASSTGPSASGTRPPSRCTASCSGCGARTRRSRRAGGSWCTRRCWPTRRWRSGSSPRRAGRRRAIGC